MIAYGIRINNRWFKDYVYLNESNKDRYSGNTALGNRIQDGDIVDVILTDLPERMEVTRSIGNAISILLGLEKLKYIIIEIVPLGVEDE